MIDLVEIEIEIEIEIESEIETICFALIFILQSVSFITLLISPFNLAAISDAWVIHLVLIKVTFQNQ